MNAKKESLEIKTNKAVLKICDTVKNIEYVLRDLSMKLCYVIRNKGKDYTVTDGFGSDYNHYGGK